MRRGPIGGRAAARRAAVIAGVVLVLAAVPAGPSPYGSVAGAQDPGGFGGYQLTASGVGLTLSPNVPAVLPVDTPFEATLALATATLSSGGQGHGLASSVFPGPLLANLRPLLGTGAGVDLPIPDYPLVVETRAHEDAKTSRTPGVTMSSNVNPDEAEVTSDLGGFTLPGIIDVGAVRTISTAKVEAGRAVATTRTEITGIDLLAGLISFDSIVTTASAETDGETSSCDGGVRIGGASVNGTPVAVDDQGLSVDRAPLVPGLDLNELVLELIDSLGVRVRVLGTLESCGGPQADRTTNGVLVSLPLPELGPVPPGGTLNLVLGATSVRANASPPFEIDLPDMPAPQPAAPTAPATGGTGMAAPPPLPAPTAPRAPGATPGPAATVAPAAPTAVDLERIDYTFAGVPTGLIAGLMLLAIPGARRVRRYLDRVTSMVNPT